MSLPLVYAPEVRDDVDAAYWWYERHRPGLGERFLAALREQLERIERNPHLYGAVHRDVRVGAMRRFPYVVYYRVETDRIRILAVQHGGWDPRRWR